MKKNRFLIIFLVLLILFYININIGYSSIALEKKPLGEPIIIEGIKGVIDIIQEDSGSCYRYYGEGETISFYPETTGIYTVKVRNNGEERVVKRVNITKSILTTNKKIYVVGEEIKITISNASIIMNESEIKISNKKDVFVTDIEVLPNETNKEYVLSFYPQTPGQYRIDLLQGGRSLAHKIIEVEERSILQKQEKGNREIDWKEILSQRESGKNRYAIKQEIIPNIKVKSNGREINAVIEVRKNKERIGGLFSGKVIGRDIAIYPKNTKRFMVIRVNNANLDASIDIEKMDLSKIVVKNNKNIKQTFITDMIFINISSLGGEEKSVSKISTGFYVYKCPNKSIIRKENTNNATEGFYISFENLEKFIYKKA